MHTVFRAVLVWMVMFAIPMQGISASTMLLCGPSHHRQQQAAQSGHDHAQHGHADHRGHAASDAVEEAASANAGADEVSGSPQWMGSAEPSNLKCSACAVCCSAVALLQVLPLMAAAQVNASVYPPLSMAYQGFVADGPQRPPRPFLA